MSRPAETDAPTLEGHTIVLMRGRGPKRLMVRFFKALEEAGIEAEEFFGRGPNSFTLGYRP